MLLATRIKREEEQEEKKVNATKSEKSFRPDSEEAADAAAAGATWTPSLEPGGGHRGSQPGPPAPPPLSCFPPANFIFSLYAGAADPSPTTGSRWGHRPARGSDRTRALPSGSNPADRPRPPFGGVLRTLTLTTAEGVGLRGAGPLRRAPRNPAAPTSHGGNFFPRRDYFFF